MAPPNISPGGLYLEIALKYKKKQTNKSKTVEQHTNFFICQELLRVQNVCVDHFSPLAWIFSVHRKVLARKLCSGTPHPSLLSLHG